VFVCAGLRELVTLGGSVDVSRGLPIVHVNFLGYDEQSHRRGPGSAFAHWTLKGIDRSIRRLHRAAVRSEKRQYDVWVFSDHGQTASRQFAKSHDGGLEGLVRRLLPDFDPSAPRLRLRSQETPSPVRTLRSRTSKRAAARDEASATLATGERDGIAVACMGPVGHVYFTKALGDDARRLLAARLVAEGVPGVLLRRDDGRADWLTRDGTHLLPDHAEMLPHPAELRAEIAADMVALAAHPDAGDVVALGFSLEGDHCTFASENGAHAGPSPDEVQGFALLPERIRLPDTAHRFIRPTMLREAAMEFLGRDERVNARRAPHRRRNTTPSAPSLPLRVATYNAHGCLGTDGILSPRRIADVLDMLDADIVAVQELDVGRARSSGVDQPAFLADALGMHHVFSPSIDGENGAYGHALLSRTPFVSTHSLRLPLGRNHLAEPRSVLVARMRWAERELVVIATHLGLGRNERERQVEYVLRECLPPAAEDVPVVVCGDLNLVPGAPAFVRLSRDLQDAQRVAPGWKCRATFPSLLPVRRLDHILVSAHFEVRAAKILGDSLARRASDHLPLAADLTLRVIKQEALPRPPACASTPFG
jgi:endonuclease/exonuclease/phosphatase family metal-dependent hydrolase